MMKRKGLVLCLVCVLLFSMTACTGGGQTPQTTPTTTGGETAMSGTTVLAKKVDVELCENGFTLDDTAFVIGGDPAALVTTLTKEKEPRMRYETLSSETYTGHRVVVRDYHTKGTALEYDEQHSDRVCTVTAAGEAEERLLAWYTTDRRYRFNGVAVGASVSLVLQHWGDGIERAGDNTDWQIGEYNTLSPSWVYPYNDVYNVVFYFSKYDEQNMRVVEIGIESTETITPVDRAVVAPTVDLAVDLDDDTFTVNGLSVEEDGDAAPLLAMLGTPEIVDANGYTDADPDSWFTIYTYDGCAVETWKPRDGSGSERFCRLLLTGERHTVNGVSVGDTCQTVVAALTPHFSSAAELGGNHQWRPPFDAYVEFAAASGISLRCGVGDTIYAERNFPTLDITDYNDRTVDMLAVG